MRNSHTPSTFKHNANNTWCESQSVYRVCHDVEGEGDNAGLGRKGPVSGSYDLIGLRAFIKPLPDQQRPAVTPPITNNYATNTVTLPPTPSTIVRKENTIIPTFFAVKYWRRCLERLLGQNLHSRKGFYGLGHWWAARWEIRRCPDQFPSVISTAATDGLGGEVGTGIS